MPRSCAACSAHDRRGDRLVRNRAADPFGEIFALDELHDERCSARRLRIRNRAMLDDEAATVFAAKGAGGIAADRIRKIFARLRRLGAARDRLALRREACRNR